MKRLNPYLNARSYSQAMLAFVPLEFRSNAESRLMVAMSVLRTDARIDADLYADKR